MPETGPCPPLRFGRRACPPLVGASGGKPCHTNISKVKTLPYNI